MIAEFRLRPHARRRSAARHPWIFRDLIADGSANSGAIVRVIDHDKRPLGFAVYSAESKIALRFLEFGAHAEFPGPEQLRERFFAAAARRAEAMEGAHDLIAFLERRKVPFGVATNNTRRHVLPMLERIGLSVDWTTHYTTIDERLQEAAYEALTKGVRRMEEANKYKGLQGAMLCMDPRTGGVLAMVGGVDFGTSQFNRALQARRQPGSAFKPIVYAAALDKGKTLVSTVDDSPIEFSRSETEIWKPKNYDDTFLGPIPLLEALAKSRNLATVRLLNEIGVDTVIGMARNLGIQSPIERNLSIALGSSGVTPLELVTAYSTFADGGQRPTPFFIREVQDGQGRVLERTTPKVVQAIAPETAYLTIRLLQEVLRTGTGASAKRLSPNLAGKTGTTNENTDAWFIGGLPNLITGVWVGFDTPTTLGKRQTAASVALPIWAQFFGQVLKFIPDREFPPPAGITFARVDPATGKEVPPGSSEGIMLPFKMGTVPETGGPAGRPAPQRRGTGDDLL